MIAKISIDVDDLRRILDSLHEPINASEDRAVDINLTIDTNDSIRFFVNSGNNIQIKHILSSSEHISVDCEQTGRLVFTSKVLRDILGKARSETIEVKFFEHEYSVRLDTEDAFSTPTSLDLNLVSSTEFTDPRDYGNFSAVAPVNRSALLESIQAMNIVSNVLHLKIINDELWLSVSDIVEGEGKLMKPTDPECEFDDLEISYSIDPIVSFLENVRSSEVTLLLNENGVLQVTADQNGLHSELFLAQQLDR